MIFNRFTVCGRRGHGNRIVQDGPTRHTVGPCHLCLICFIFGGRLLKELHSLNEIIHINVFQNLVQLLAFRRVIKKTGDVFKPRNLGLKQHNLRLKVLHVQPNLLLLCEHIVALLANLVK